LVPCARLSAGTGTALPETSSEVSADTQYITGSASGRHLAVGYPRTGQLFQKMNQICFFDTTNPLGASPSRASMVELDASTQQRQHHKCKYWVECSHSNPPRSLPSCHSKIYSPLPLKRLLVILPRAFDWLVDAVAAGQPPRHLAWLDRDTIGPFPVLTVGSLRQRLPVFESVAVLQAFRV
jgi:hypothetical protein